MVAVADKLGIDGGAPVRPRRLPVHYPGATMIGDEEKREVLDVLERRSPFRYYGPQPAYKAAELEREFAAMTGVEHALGVTSCTAALIVALRALKSSSTARGFPTRRRTPPTARGRWNGSSRSARS